ncbi:MAG: hypothetical protein M1819_000137 [Sarea resinae]|nr:MAG: hypothetical protein M1819_000137 [Sarea resinae]
MIEELDSPSTPGSTASFEARHTRSGRPVTGRSQDRMAVQTKPRTTKVPRMRKAAKQGKADKRKVPKLEAPLSVLTKDYNHIPVRDMKAWVNRSIEVRRQEVEKLNGYIKRPMNSFILYRSAFAERTKLWCLQNNHQVVSSVSGESWPMEPVSVRDEYNEMARVERINHQDAHPGYKFCPSKAQTANRKRKQSSDLEEDEHSDLDDGDSEWGRSSQRQLRTKPKKRQIKEVEYAASSGSGDDSWQDGSGFNTPGYVFLNEGPQKSSYQANNPGKPLPTAMSAVDMPGQYYQTTVHPNAAVPNVEDVRIRRTETPGMLYGGTPPLLGLPGGSHYDLMQPQPYRTSNGFATDQSQVDPLLLAYDSSHLAYTDGQMSEASNGSFHHMDHGAHFDSSYGMVDRGLGPDGLGRYISSAPQYSQYHQHMSAYQTQMPMFSEVDDHFDSGHFQDWMGVKND